MQQEYLKYDKYLSQYYLLILFFQFNLHLINLVYMHDIRIVMPTIVAFLHDFVLMTILIIILNYPFLVAHQKLLKLFKSISYSLMVIAGLLLSIYPNILSEYLVFSVNIFSTEPNTVEHFLVDYLGFYSSFPPLLFLIVAVGVFYSKIDFHLSYKLVFKLLVLSTFIMLFTIRRESPNPVVYSVQYEINVLLKNEKRAVESIDITESHASSYDIIQEISYPLDSMQNYDNILIIVLEGITSESFESEFMTFKGGFYELTQKSSVYYNNYYASNLDSYTSLIAMMTGIQVPFQSYTQPDIFKEVNNASNLVEYFSSMGYTTTFLSTYEHQPYVPNLKYWDYVLDRNDLPNDKKWLSLGKTKMEMATEDKMAISTIIDKITTDSCNFIMHELVFGHSTEWQSKTEKTPLEYYDEYLNELYDELEKSNKTENTLFVIVSDHGVRALSSELENYRVPLLIFSNQIVGSKNNNFLSHLDLPRIVFSYNNSLEHPISRESMFFVGSTERWIYGYANKNKEFVFIDDENGTVTAEYNIDPPVTRENFNEFVVSFKNKYFQK